MGIPTLNKILLSQLFLARMYQIVTDPTLTELARRLSVDPMTDTDTTAVVDTAAAVETPAPVAEKPKRTRTPRAVTAPEPAAPEKPKRTREPRAVAAPAPKTSETAPIAILSGGDRNETYWQKLQRGPWPQAMDGATGEPVTPIRAVRLLSETTTGIYVHVERLDVETGKALHFYVHSSIITAWRLLWGAE